MGTDNIGESEVKLRVSADTQKLKEYTQALEEVKKAHKDLADTVGDVELPRRGRGKRSIQAGEPPVPHEPPRIVRYDEQSFADTGDVEMPWASGSGNYMPPPLPRAPREYKATGAGHPPAAEEPFKPKITRYADTPTGTGHRDMYGRDVDPNREQSSYAPPPLIATPNEEGEWEGDEEEEAEKPTVRRRHGRLRETMRLGLRTLMAPAIVGGHLAAEMLVGGAKLAATPLTMGADAVRYARSGEGWRGFQNAYGTGDSNEFVGGVFGRAFSGLSRVSATASKQWADYKDHASAIVGDKAEDEGDPEERRHSELMKALKGYSGQGYTVGKNVAANMISQGLGSSVFGFLAQSSQEYIQHADLLQKLSHQYGSFGKAVRGAGYEMGMVLEKSAALTFAIGAQINTVDKATFQRYAGFARHYRIEGEQVAGTMGRLERISGGHFFDMSMQQKMQNRLRLGMSHEQSEGLSADFGMEAIHARAVAAGMGNGRQGEYYQAYTQAAEAQFSATGHVTPAGVNYAMEFAGAIFGSKQDPRAQGETGFQYGQQVGRMVSGDTSTAMRVFMMRALDYGKKGGMSYLDTREQLDRGMFDSRNTLAYFKRLREMTVGMSPEKQEEEGVKMMEQDANKAGMSFAGLRSLIRRGTSDEGYQELQELAKSSSSLDLSSTDMAEKLGKGGFAAIGKKETTKADERQIQIEQMKASLGPIVTDVLIHLGEVAKNTAKGLDKLFKGLTGEGIMQTIDKLAASAEGLSEVFDALSGSAAARLAKRGVGGTLADAAHEAGDLLSNDSLLGRNRGGTPYNPARGAKNPARAGQPDAGSGGK